MARLTASLVFAAWASSASAWPWSHYQADSSDCLPPQYIYLTETITTTFISVSTITVAAPTPNVATYGPVPAANAPGQPAPGSATTSPSWRFSNSTATVYNPSSRNCTSSTTPLPAPSGSQGSATLSSQPPTGTGVGSGEDSANIILNGGFEDGGADVATSWNSLNVEFDGSFGQPHSGRRFANMIAQGDPDFAQEAGLGQNVNVTASTTYNLSFWYWLYTIRTPSPNTCSLRVTFGETNVDGGNFQFTRAGNGYTQFNSTVLVSVSNADLGFSFFCYDPTSFASLLIDDVSFEQL